MKTLAGENQSRQREATTKHMVALPAAWTGNNKTHGGSACCTDQQQQNTWWLSAWCMVQQQQNTWWLSAWCTDRQQQNTWWLCLLHWPATTKHMVALPAAWTGNNKTHGGSLPDAQTGNNKTHGGSACCTDRQQQNTWWLCLLHGPATTKHMVALCLVHRQATTKHMVALCLVHRQATTKHMVALPAAWTGNNKTHGGSAWCTDRQQQNTWWLSAWCMVRQQQNTWWLCLMHRQATTKHTVALPAAWTGNNKTHGGSLPDAQTGNNKTHGGSACCTLSLATHWRLMVCLDRHVWWYYANSHISLHTADTNCQPVDISSTGYVHFYPHRLAVFKWCALYCVVCMRACMCVCVDGMKLKYALRWHINVSVHSILCQCHKHMYSQTIWGQQTDGAKSGYCPSTLLAWHNIIHFVSLT